MINPVELSAVSIRHDDLVNDVAVEYVDPVAIHVAESLAEVRPVLQAAESAARNGRWVVGFVSYEAAPAFDSAMVVHADSGPVPLALFVEFERCRIVDSVAGCLDPVAFDIDRLGGADWYRRNVEFIRQRIASGDVYQVNLTDRCRLDAVNDARSLYFQMIAAQRSASNWFLDLGNLAISSASPEVFFQFDGETLLTRPMKGTAPRQPRQAEDLQAATDLRASEKDCAENLMIVDLLRNDASRIARRGGVSVPQLFELERYETVWQLTSTVKACTRAGISLADVFSVLFPCGSVTGAPRIAAMDIIAAIEPWPRGMYCGAIGVVGPPPKGAAGIRARFNVAIRTAVIDRTTGECTYGSGGGITWGSNPADENAELEAKTAVLTARRPPFDLLETLLMDGDGPRHFERHLKRLSDSADYFAFDVDIDAIRAEVVALPSPSNPMRLRITAQRSRSHHISLTPLDTQTTPVLLGVAGSVIRSDDPFVCHKTTYRHVYDLARADRPGVNDVILINERGEVVETTVASIIYRWSGHWYTPPLSSGGLDGVGRHILLEQGSITERVLSLSELADCNALATVSSLRGRRSATLVPDRAPGGVEMRKTS